MMNTDNKDCPTGSGVAPASPLRSKIHYLSQFPGEIQLIIAFSPSKFTVVPPALKDILKAVSLVYQTLIKSSIKFAPIEIRRSPGQNKTPDYEFRLKYVWLNFLKNMWILDAN